MDENLDELEHLRKQSGGSTGDVFWVENGIINTSGNPWIYPDQRDLQQL